MPSVMNEVLTGFLTDDYTPDLHFHSSTRRNRGFENPHMCRTKRLSCLPKRGGAEDLTSHPGQCSSENAIQHNPGNRSFSNRQDDRQLTAKKCKHTRVVQDTRNNRPKQLEPPPFANHKTVHLLNHG